MDKTAEDIKKLVLNEVEKINDISVRQQLQHILVSPKFHVRDWDYGKKGETYPCWTVAEHQESDTAIAYSDYGFGPKMPWGLVMLSGNWFGMDCGWFESLEAAFRDSMMFEA